MAEAPNVGSAAKTPFIWLRNQHYVVVEKASSLGIQFYDPARRVSESTAFNKVDENFRAIVLELNPIAPAAVGAGEQS